MRLRIVIDKEKEEEILIYVHKRNSLTESIERLVESTCELVAYGEKGAVKLNENEVYCFISEKGKTYAITEKEKLQVKMRLYQLEERLGRSFVKLNQSCIGNTQKMKRFEAEFSGSLTVTFKNGYKDYISRRQLKTVKERLGI